MSTATELIDAIQRGAADEIAALLAADPSVADARHESGTTALLLAIYHGQAAIAEQLAAVRQELSTWELAALGRTSDLNLALDTDPRALDAPADDGFRLLGLAAFFGHESTVALLLELGADTSLAAENPTAVTALHSAVAFRDRDVGLANARRLIAHGAPVDAAQQGGWTALHAAAMHGNEPLVRLLLDQGASLSFATDDGKTAAMMAEEAGHRELAALLSD